LSLKALQFLQKKVLNIIFPGGEHATNLITANVEVLSHNNRKQQPQLSQLFFRRSRVWGTDPPLREEREKGMENREETAGNG